MANEVIKIHNVVNDVTFKNFTSVELDIFFSICFQMKEKGLDVITMTFDDIKKLSKYRTKGTVKDFYEYLKNMYDKLIQLNFSHETGTIGKRKFVKFILFNRYYIDEEKRIVEIGLHKDFEYISNKLTANFTRFELEEFTKLKSSYSKQMFKLLSQFNSTGVFIISLEDFRTKLDVPVSYKMHHIDSRILKPILSELCFYFQNLKLEKIKKGRNIDKLKFTFNKRKEKTLGFTKGNPVIADDRSFEEIREAEKNSVREEFEALDRKEQVKLVRNQLSMNRKI